MVGIELSCFFSEVNRQATLQKYNQNVYACRPSKGFNHCIEVYVFIKATPEELYAYITDIENNSEYFPDSEFKRDRKGPLEIGEIYYSREVGEKEWTEYRIIALEKNRRMSGELIGKHPLLRRLRYDHRLIEVEGGTISTEKVEYSLRFGLLGKLLNFLYGKNMLKKILLQAHQRLKEKAENKKKL